MARGDKPVKTLNRRDRATSEIVLASRLMGTKADTPINQEDPPLWGGPLGRRGLSASGDGFDYYDFIIVNP